MQVAKLAAVSADVVDFFARSATFAAQTLLALDDRSPNIVGDRARLVTACEDMAKQDLKNFADIRLPEPPDILAVVANIFGFIGAQA